MGAGRPLKIKTPDELWEHFKAYKVDVKSNPYTVKDWVGKDGDQVEREKERPLTMVGFELYLENQGVIKDASDYFANSNNRYAKFSAICSRITKSIREDQIGGGMAGIYNPSITQRLNGLADNQNINVQVEQPLFPEA